MTASSPSSSKYSPGYIDTYYTRTLTRDQPYAPLQNDVSCDVCVVGAGLAGINTAFGLVERGQNNVVVIDQHRIGWGASSRNGGFVAKGYSAGEDTLVDKVGLDHARKLVNLTKSARQLIRDRIASHDIDCGPLTPGVLTVSWENSQSGFAEKIAEMNRDFDVGLEYWPVERVREHCKTTRYFDAMYSPHDFQFHSLRYIQSLAALIVQKGAHIFENTPALSITQAGADPQAGWLVRTPQGVIRAKKIVVCCSIYSQGLNRKLENAAFPVKTFVMVTDPVSEADLAASINTPHAIYDTRFASDYYRVLPDRRIMWGGRVQLWGSPHNLAQAMFKDMLKVYPQLEGKTRPDVAWSGLMCYAPHKMPQIGEVAPGYWYNMGYGGHGLVPTTVGGEAVAQAILGLDPTQDQTYQLFAPFGLSYAGGGMGRYVAQMVYWWWRVRDALSSKPVLSGAE